MKNCLNRYFLIINLKNLVLKTTPVDVSANIPFSRGRDIKIAAFVDQQLLDQGAGKGLLRRDLHLSTFPGTIGGPDIVAMVTQSVALQRAAFKYRPKQTTMKGFEAPPVAQAA